MLSRCLRRLPFVPMLLVFSVVVLLCTTATGYASANEGGRPNIIFVLADDLGWTDLTCMGSRYYETPHIDRLAEQGLKFSNYTVCQNCAPTRAALMSGQYAPRTGVYTVGSLARGKETDRKMELPKNVTRLPLKKIIVAQTLQRAGYVTGMFGKWHLGNKEVDHPSQRGFDEAIVSKRGHFEFRTFPKVSVPKGQYLADFLTDRAIDFIDRHQKRPFFLYLPNFAVHTPIQAKETLIAKYRDKEPVGGHNDPVYAAMINSVDDSVGRIMDKLEELGIADNTILIFTSDNGGLGGYEVPGSDNTKGITDNAPLRGGKGTLYEGGVRVPLIIRWPKVIAAGGTCDEPAVHVDMYPTFVELAKAEVPDAYTLDGVSLAPLLRSPLQSLDREAIYAHFPGYLQSYIKEAVWRTTPVSTIRVGNWKLMEFFEDDHLELYNLAEDLGERKNLVDQEPERTRELHEKLVAWRKNTGAAMPRRKAMTAE
ncbi:MAG: sulfatase [Planctomycetes bacterium]|nr:sulfatase [Planctomycetota bacterium]